MELQSKFAMGEVVALHFGHFVFPAHVRGIKIQDDGDVFYDLDVFFDLEKSLHSVIGDVHFALIKKAPDGQTQLCPHRAESKASVLHGLIHDACFHLAEGRIDQVKDILKEADMLSHDLC